MTRKREQKKDDSNAKYTGALLSAFILMAIPQILSGYASLKIALYILCYILSIVIMVLALSKCRIHTDKAKIWIVLLYIVINILPFLRNTITGMDTSINDIIDLPIKITSMILFFLLTPTNMNDEHLRKFYKGVSVFILIASIYNIFLNANEILRIFNIRNSYLLNFSSFFPNRNTFAMYLVCGVYSTLQLIDGEIDKRHKRKWLLVLVFLLANIVLTMSRTSMLTSIIILLPACLSFLKKKKANTIILLPLLAIMLLAIIGNHQINNTVERLFIRSEAGTSGRSELWLRGIQQSRRYGVITGAGYYTALDDGKASQYHSMYVDTLVDTGLLGILAKSIILVYIYRCPKKTKKPKRLPRKYITFMLSILFMGLFESVNFFALGSSEMVFTIMCISIPLTIKERSLQ